MKYTIIIPQLALHNIDLINKVDIVDAALLDYILDFCNAARMDKIQVNNAEYTRINFKHLISEMPILGIKEKDTISARIKKLKKLDLLYTFQTKDNTLYIRPGDKAYYIFFSNQTCPKNSDRLSEAARTGYPKNSDSTNIISKHNTKTTTTGAEDVKDIMAYIKGSKFKGEITENDIIAALAAYKEDAHFAYQPETAAEGVKRILSWMPHVIITRNPAGFLISCSGKGMSKPRAVTNREQAAKAAQREAEERRKEREKLDALKNERDIPLESRAELDRLLGRARAAV